MTDVEMFLVRLQDGASQAREWIAEWVAVRGGVVLMATSGGSLIVAMARDHRDALAAEPQVALVGGVSLHPSGRAVEALKRQFEINAGLQAARLQERVEPTEGSPR
jgi:hypothetical protein